MGERENRGLKKGNKPNEMLSNDQSNETSIMTKDDSDEDLGTIDEVVQPKVKVAYKNPSISKKSNLKKPGPEENQSSGGVTAFNLPTPDSAAWGKIKTPIEELKVRFVVIGDEPTTKIEGWYNLEPLKNVKRESEEYGVDFSNLAYAMKLVSSDENDDVELIITRRSKRANKELPQSGSIHIMFPFIGNASKEEPTLHELRRRTLSSKSLTKKLQKKNQISSSSNFVKGSTIANDDDISLPSLDHNYQRKISKQAKLSSQPTPVEGNASSSYEPVAGPSTQTGDETEITSYSDETLAGPSSDIGKKNYLENDDSEEPIAGPSRIEAQTKGEENDVRENPVEEKEVDKKLSNFRNSSNN